MPKKDKIYLVSPVVKLRYPWLQKPDTEYKSEGEYKVQLILDPNNPDDKKFLKRVEKLRKEAVETIINERGTKKKTKTASSLIKKDTDKETGEDTGLYYITTKLLAKVSPKNSEPFEQSPTLFTKRGDLFASEAIIGSGTTAQVSMEAYPYYNPSGGAGLSLRLKAVLIVDLVEYSGSSKAEGFGFTVEVDAEDTPLDDEDEDEEDTPLDDEDGIATDEDEDEEGSDF